MNKIGPLVTGAKAVVNGLRNGVTPARSLSLKPLNAGFVPHRAVPTVDGGLGPLAYTAAKGLSVSPLSAKGGESSGNRLSFVAAGLAVAAVFSSAGCEPSDNSATRSPIDGADNWLDPLDPLGISDETLHLGRAKTDSEPVQSQFLALCAEASFKLNFDPSHETGLHIGAPKGFLSPTVIQAFIDSHSTETITSLLAQYRNPNGYPEWTAQATRFVEKLSGVEGLKPSPIAGLKQLSALARSYVVDVLGHNMKDVDVVTFSPGYRSSFYNLGEEATVQCIEIRNLSNRQILDQFKKQVLASEAQGKKVMVWWQTQNPMGVVLDEALQSELRDFVKAHEGKIIGFVEDNAYAGMSLSPKLDSVSASLIDKVDPKKMLVMMGISTSKIINTGGHNGGIVCGNYPEWFIQDITNNLCSGLSKLALAIQAMILENIVDDTPLDGAEKGPLATKIEDGLETTCLLSELFNDAGISATNPDIGPFILLDFSDIADHIEGTPQDWLRRNGICTLSGESTNIAALPNSPQQFDGYDNFVRTAWCGLTRAESLGIAKKIIELYKDVKNTSSRPKS